MSTDEVRRSRRAILATAAGGAAALAAAQLARPASALAAGGPVNLDTDNPSTALTSVTQGTANADAFAATGKGKGIGLRGASTSGAGVLGATSESTMSGVVGLAGNPADSYYNDVLADPTNESLEAGVYGYCSDTPGHPTGVYGEASGDLSTGVYGEADGYGILGIGWGGVVGVGEQFGIHGHGGSYSWPMNQPARTGVLATCSAGGVALDVRGKTKSDRAKNVTIKKGTSKLKVTLAGVTTSSQVFAILRAYRSGVYVAAVAVSSGYFTIYLNKTLTSNITCSYFVVN